VHVYQGFWVTIFVISPGQGFLAIARGTPILLGFSAIYDPFGTPIFRQIFHHFPSGSHRGTYGSLVVHLEPGQEIYRKR